MRKPEATLGAAAFFVVAPGVVAGAVPWLLTDWHSGGSVAAPLRWLGVALVVAGAAVLVFAFARFVTEGSGTPGRRVGATLAARASAPTSAAEASGLATTGRTNRMAAR